MERYKNDKDFLAKMEYKRPSAVKNVLTNVFNLDKPKTNKLSNDVVLITTTTQSVSIKNQVGLPTSSMKSNNIAQKKSQDIVTTTVSKITTTTQEKKKDLQECDLNIYDNVYPNGVEINEIA
ncbi:MAG: hypothetical protein PHO23_02840 [Candidatus Pacebacteria bacterium]|nr:hypothetical protein [Candidatus Paceibacterota bacterium]